MEISSRHSRLTQQHQHRRSGYEPSDTETEWVESSFEQPDVMALERKMNITTQDGNNGGLSWHPALIIPTPAYSSRRRYTNSPYKPNREDRTTNVRSFVPEITDVSRRHVSPLSRRNHDHGIQRNVSPFSKSEARRHVSSYKTIKGYDGLGLDDEEEEEIITSNRKHGHRQADNEVAIKDKVISKSNYSRRSMSAPRQRPHKDQENNVKSSTNSHRRDQEGSYEINAPSASEINERLANVKINTRGLGGNVTILESTDSISPGDIFFSRDYATMAAQKTVLQEGNGFDTRFSPRKNSHQGIAGKQTSRGISTSTVTRTTATCTSALSRQSSDMSDSIGRTIGEGLKRFTSTRQRSSAQSETAWFFCIKKGYCSTSNKSSKQKKAFDEASFIAKAFVVESLRQFWADKHQPTSLNGFICHKQEALQLKQLISHGLQFYQVQDTRPTQVAVPVASSPHHFELNPYLEPNSRYALFTLVKQINSSHAIAPEISTINMKADYSVIILYDVDKSEEGTQHLIKWSMDCYTDMCKFIICCEDDADIIESVKSRCKVLKLDAPVTHEVMEVLLHIAKMEEFELPMNFAAKIATKSKQNLRRAIMALEACKTHNYPFIEEQPIPIGWEDTLVEVAAEILVNPSHDKLFSVRSKLQKLLQDFVHPKLILLKLIEQFLKGVDASSKRELYFWHTYYDKRLPLGTSALLKLEEFLAKFMGIHRKSFGSRQ